MSGDQLSDKQRAWLDHVEACVASGGSMKRYAEKNGLDLQSFYLWKGRLKKLGVIAGRTVEVAVEPVRISQTPTSCGSRTHGTRIELGDGVRIEVPHNFDVDMLCDLVRHVVSVCRR